MADISLQIEDKYEILGKLNEGGMGTVYKVRHRLLDDIRVIKLVQPHLEDQNEFRARFSREARFAVKLIHPNIIRLLDFSLSDDGTAYMILEFVDGIDLAQLLRYGGTPPLALCLDIAIQSLEALAYLHDTGLVHRDISPDNLMLTTSPEGTPQVKLLDLGLARSLSGATETRLTTAGSFLGKVRYASPEHFMAEAEMPVDERSDLYSFGVVLYELLTGQYPIRGGSPSSILAGHLHLPPIDFAESDPDSIVPTELRSIVLMMLEKAPQGRPENARAAIESLRLLQAHFSLETTAFRKLLRRIADSRTAVKLAHQTGIQPPTRDGPRRTLVRPGGNEPVMVLEAIKPWTENAGRSQTQTSLAQSMPSDPAEMGATIVLAENQSTAIRRKTPPQPTPLAPAGQPVRSGAVPTLVEAGYSGPAEPAGESADSTSGKSRTLSYSLGVVAIALLLVLVTAGVTIRLGPVWSRSQQAADLAPRRTEDAGKAEVQSRDAEAMTGERTPDDELSSAVDRSQEAPDPTDAHLSKLANTTDPGTESTTSDLNEYAEPPPQLLHNAPTFDIAAIPSTTAPPLKPPPTTQPAVKRADPLLPQPEERVEFHHAVKLHAPPVQYPDAARQAGQEGRVVVQAEIDASGSVTQTTVISGSSPDLNEAVRVAVGKWRFRPATRGGEPVNDIYQVAIKFELDPRDRRQPLPVGGDVKAPTRLISPPPIYTTEALEARIKGRVMLQATIDEQGDVIAVRVREGLSHGLTESAVEAVRSWKFEPATLYGKPVLVTHILAIRFQ